MDRIYTARPTGRRQQPVRQINALARAVSMFVAGTLAATGLHAQSVADSATGIDEAVVLPRITVTGEKSDRSIFDTSSSAEIYDALRIESMPEVRDAKDLLRLTPNVVDVGTANEVPTVRGVEGSGPARGAVAFLGGTRPRLNMSVDGRSLSYNELAFGPRSVWDIERVEIFRGPQSHVQGRNAIAGAVVLTSKDPTFHWEGALKGVGGEQDYYQTAAVVSGPIVDGTLAFRVSADQQQRESFANLGAYSPVGDPREIETTTYRAKLLHNAETAGLTNKLTVEQFESKGPQNEALIPPPALRSARFDARRPVFETESLNGIWDLGWVVSDHIRFENKVIYTEFENHRRTVLTLPYADIDGDEFLIEPLVHFQDGKETLTGLAGIRYLQSQQDEFVNILGGSYFDDETETASAFVEVTYALLPQIDVTASGRFEHEQRERIGGSGAVAIDFDETYEAFLPKLDVAWKPTDEQTLGVMVSRGYNPGGAAVTVPAPYISYSYDEEYVWSYELYSRHRLADGRVELTSNIFLNEYDDMQLPYYLGPTSTIIRNADKVETYGAELGARWLPVAELELSGSIGLLHTEVEKFADSGIEGNELARAPSYSAAIGATYRFLSAFELSANATYQDTYYSYFDNDVRGEIDAYWEANLQLAYNFAYGRVTVFAHNLFDSDEPIMVVDNDVNSPIMQRPRLVGGSIELNF